MASSIALTRLAKTTSDWTVTVVRPDPVLPDSSLAGLSEIDLVAACLGGHAGAFDLIVERHRRSIYQLCYRFVGNHEDASDLSQDVFLRAYRGLKSFRGQSSIATWLYRIGVNVCLNRVSVKKPRTESIDERQHVDMRESVSDQLLKDERAIRVREAVAALPRKQRAALVLRVYHEMSHQEVADIVGTSVGAVKANVFHALQNLKKLLGSGSLTMSHLAIDELLDLAEGSRAESEADRRHLASCEACRGRLNDVQQALSTIVEPIGRDVPEPSPLFWDHLSTRVHEAVAAEPTPGPSPWTMPWPSWRLLMPAAACVVALLAVTLTMRTSRSVPVTTPDVQTSSAAPTDAAASDTFGDDDASWSLMTDLAGDLDWDAAADAGLTPGGSVDRALFDLTADERQTLHRLLQDELSHSGV